MGKLLDPPTTPAPVAPTLPPQFTVTCRIAGCPAAGLPVGVTLHTRLRNAHYAIAGRTDEEGKLVVERDRLLDEATANLRLFPADYVPINGPGGFDGRVTVSVPTLDELNAAMKAYDDFNGVTDYPPGYRAELEAGKVARAAVAGKPLTVSVSGVHPGLTFDTRA